MKPACRIELLGGMRLQRNGQTLTRLETRKTEALLAYLAFYPHRAHPRELLAEMLWPDEEPETVRNRFKQALSVLRRAIDPPDSPAGSLLIADRLEVRINPEAITTDVTEFETLLQASAQGSDPAESACLIEQAIPLYRGELLPGYYEDWIARERERLAEAYRSALSRLMSARAKAGDLTGAIEAAMRAVQADPLRDASHYDLMRLYVAAGRPSEALRQYRQLEQLLQEQLGTSPSPAVKTLAEQLRREGASRPVAAPVAAGSLPTPALARSGSAVHAQSQAPGNLPQLLTSFIGRQQETAEIERLLVSTPLLTLTGSGGCGKTRLALQIATEKKDAYPDGVWLVELATLSDSALVAQAVARALGVPEETGTPIAQTLRNALQHKQALLLLDNCEHLLAACADLAEIMLQGCPGLRLLCTSREPLRIGGEQVHRVPSLFAPDPAQLPHEEKELAAIIAEFDSVRLFIDRARFHQPDFVLNRANAPVIASLCYRLDGIPLAIELAAARVKAMPVDAIHTRLDDRFRLLTTGSRTALPRQQTLRAALDWSYELLAPNERLLLQRLAVFAGGFTLEAAEQVTGDREHEQGTGYREQGIGIRQEGVDEGRGSKHAEEGIIPGACSLFPVTSLEVLELLANLIDKSLVVYETWQGQARYRLLETIREYSLEILEQSGQSDRLYTRHRDYFLTRAEQAESHRNEARQKEWLDRLEEEHDNLRAALAYSRRDPQQAHTYLRLAGAVFWFWEIRGYYSEGREHLQAALSTEAGELPTPEAAKALHGAGILAWRQCDFTASRALHERSLAIRRDLGDRQGIASSLNSLGNVALDQGDYPTAQALYAESLEIKKDLGDKQGIAAALNNLAIVAYQQGDYTQARALHEQSLQMEKRRGDRWGIAISLGNLGEVVEKQGDYALARTLLEESLEMRRELGDRWGIAMALNNLGHLAYREGDAIRTRALYEESLALRRELGDKYGVAASLIHLGNLARLQGDYAQAHGLLEESLTIVRELEARQGIAELLQAFADLAAEQGQHERAVRLWAAVETLRTALSFPLPPEEKTAYQQRMAAARSALGEEAFVSAWAQGQTLTIEQAIEDTSP